MNYYSTNHKAPTATLEEAVIKGLAPDRGLYMPEEIKTLPASFFNHIETLSFQEIAFEVATCFFGDDIEAADLKNIVCDTLSFDIPIVNIENNIYSLELFHGPTLAFKDVGARFMARLLRHFIRKESRGQVNVLVATSGDTGSAVANGFLGVDGIHVYVLYPKGKVSPIQESQFTTLGRNITALEVDGVFDDCQALVKQAFMDEELNRQMRLTSANSINVARFLPQAFYYFYAYAQLKRQGKADNVVVCVPSGNFGNLCAGLFESGNPDLIGICGGTARKRAREHDDVPAAHLAHKPVEHPSQLLVCDLGTRLVDVGVRLERGILDLEVGARLTLDLKHLALDAQLGQHVTQHGAGVTAKKRDGHGFRSQLTHDLRDIDALATGIYAQLADAVHGIEPQILDGCRLVEGGIERDGIDHRTTTFLWRTTMRANMRSYLRFYQHRG